MIQISFKKVLIVFSIIFLMSQAKKIARFFSELELEFESDGILTLEPLRNCSVEARYLVTVALVTACFVVAWKIFMNFKK